jgi:hypothetical protein
MARTRTTGKLLTKAPSAKESKMATGPVVDEAFATRWNALEKSERRQIRRLVRIGLPQPTPEAAELAVGFAAYQRTRPWFRYFWLWIWPLAIAALIAAANLHPIVMGLVLGAVVVSFMSRRNFKRAEKVNAPVLTGESDAVPAAA